MTLSIMVLGISTLSIDTVTPYASSKLVVAHKNTYYRYLRFYTYAFYTDSKNIDNYLI